jgi:hypothetical protein
VPEPLDIRDKVREALRREGLLPPAPDQSIPVRYWPTSSLCVLGYLDIYRGERDGDTEQFSMTFREAPLHGEQPRFDLAFTPEQENHRA